MAKYRSVQVQQGRGPGLPSLCHFADAVRERTCVVVGTVVLTGSLKLL